MSPLWMNPGPFPHRLEWVLLEQVDENWNFEWRCRVCDRSFRRAGFGWIGPGPLFVDVLKALHKQKSKADAAHADLCPGRVAAEPPAEDVAEVREPTDDEIYNLPGVEGGIAYPMGRRAGFARRERLPPVIGTPYLLPDGRWGRVIARWLGEGCPRNVLIEFADGSRTVRPFRGLRRYCSGECRDPWFNECADCWHAAFPASATTDAQAAVSEKAAA